MARKSRKNSSQPESAAQIGQVSYVTAIYARLSVENSGKQDEGASLQNQIDVCKEYVAGCPYIKSAAIREKIFLNEKLDFCHNIVYYYVMA